MALERLQQEEALRVAEIDGLVQCPFCDYAAICGPIEEDKEFRCQNPECMCFLHRVNHL
jgi:TRIAD3 protein (E3 ubiquitin-protein ligase RNF216)